MIRLNDAFKVPGQAGRFLRAVIAYIDDTTNQSFDHMVDVISGLPAEAGRGVLTWPVVTLLPFLADPAAHMFLKPQVSQRIADVFLFDLLYDSRPTWGTYQRLLVLSERLLNRLRPLGARDLVDVQSFMWVVEGAAYMKKSKA